MFLKSFAVSQVTEVFFLVLLLKVKMSLMIDDGRQPNLYFSQGGFYKQCKTLF